MPSLSLSQILKLFTQPLVQVGLFEPSFTLPLLSFVSLWREMWHHSPAWALWIFEAIICPKLSYGCSVWSHSLNRTNKNHINKVPLPLIHSASGIENIFWNLPQLAPYKCPGRSLSVPYSTTIMGQLGWSGGQAGERSQDIARPPPEPTLHHSTSTDVGTRAYN